MRGADSVPKKLGSSSKIIPLSIDYNTGTPQWNAGLGSGTSVKIGTYDMTDVCFIGLAFNLTRLTNSTYGGGYYRGSVSISVGGISRTFYDYSQTAYIDVHNRNGLVTISFSYSGEGLNTGSTGSCKSAGAKGTITQLEFIN